jgi:RNA polymerase sigma-70 factor (sigma-E family)
VHTTDRGFDAFVRGRSTALLRTAYLLTGDRGHAEDLLQGVLERTARRWSSIAESPEAYVRKALANAATNRWRQRRPTEVELLDVHDRAAPDTASAYAVHDALMRALRALPARQRAVLVLRYFDDMSEAETAAALGCSVGTVKSQASRGLDRLRALVDDHDSEPAPARSAR